MKLTADRFFTDSNILLYLLSDVENKKEIAKQLLRTNPVISTQVITENINVAFKKFKSLTPQQILQHKNFICLLSELVLINEKTIDLALEIKSEYQYQWFDSLIIASALQANCTILYSEDMQHNQQIENRLIIINPFI